MDDYIKRSALFEELKKRDFIPAIVRRAIEAVPAEDVSPVAHGYWEFPIFLDGDENYQRCKCSECGSIETPLARHKFCPSCGEKMDL